MVPVVHKSKRLLTSCLLRRVYMMKLNCGVVLVPRVYMMILNCRVMLGENDHAHILRGFKNVL